MPNSASAEDLTQRVTATFSKAASRYDTSGAAFHRPIAARLVRLAALTRGQRVLDAGCGAGACLIPAAEAVGPDGQVTGIDLSGEMMARAAAEARRRRLTHVQLDKADAAAPPYPAESFDVVLASLVMFLLPDPGLAAREWLRLLRPGGTLGFSWGIASDPRWRPVMTAVDDYVPGAGFDAFLRRPPFSSAANVEAVLTMSGYTSVRTITEPITVRYADPEQWWDACWSETPLLAWQHIPLADRPTAQKAAFAQLDDLAETDGTLVCRFQIGFTLARRPTKRPG